MKQIIGLNKRESLSSILDREGRPILDTHKLRGAWENCVKTLFTEQYVGYVIPNRDVDMIGPKILESEVLK